MDNVLKQFSEALSLLGDYDLQGALSIMLPYLETHPYMYHSEELQEINKNLQLMKHYMEQGAADESREEMYLKMVGKARKCIRNIRTEYRRQNVDFYKDATAHVNLNFSVSTKAIRMKLEDFVSDIAMLQLESDNTVVEKVTKEIYSAHYAYLQSLFCLIVVSDIWTEEEATQMEQTLLSPTVDANDVQLIISAMMIATMNNYDYYKFRTLIHVYDRTNNIKIRQRALVAWVFSSTNENDDGQKTDIGIICQKPETRKDIIELQKQIFFCTSAERDNNIIERDILPTLTKNVNISRLGISEKDDSVKIQDIIDPEAEDREMEKIEDRVKQIMDMQKQGADIYFSGFSQMKRFPFFYTLANWFFPFNYNHPDIPHNEENRKFMDVLFCNMPFCESDKYSFAIATANLIGKMPKEMMEMVASNAASSAQMADKYADDAPFIRRMVLQDLYRFCRLYRWHQQVYNPFSNDNALFITNSLFSNTVLSKQFPTVAQFLMSRNETAALKKIMPFLEANDNPKALMLSGMYHLDKTADYEAAKRCFEKVLETQPDNERAMMGLAKASFRNGNLEDAKNIYTTLCSKDDTPKGLGIELGVILTKLEQFNEAAQLLYKLDFQYPDSPNIKRILAWTLMGLHKLLQADKEYSRLIEKPDAVCAMDYLNAAYCKWFKHDIKTATQWLAEYYRLSQDKKNNTAGNASYSDFSRLLLNDFHNDAKMLHSYKINMPDKMLMVQIAYDKYQNLSTDGQEL